MNPFKDLGVDHGRIMSAIGIITEVADHIMLIRKAVKLYIGTTKK